MDRDILETRTHSSAWYVAGVAIAIFFISLFIFKLFT